MPGNEKSEKLNGEQIKAAVKRAYGERLSGCCSPSSVVPLAGTKRRWVTGLGYAQRDVERLPSSAVEFSFGCGNPLALADISEGAIVLDLGSGAGMDCLLAAEKVGPTGKVIGLDMTPAMVRRARENAHAAGVTNVEFRLGDVEQMPVESESVDWVISNCVINLTPNKRMVFAEIFRVLKPGGRVSISDIVLGEPLPESVVRHVAAWVGCVAGAITEAEHLRAMRDAGLTGVRVVSRWVLSRDELGAFLADWSGNPAVSGNAAKELEAALGAVAGNVWSARIVAEKPIR